MFVLLTTKARLKHRTWQRVSVLQSLIKLLNNLGREEVNMATGGFWYPRTQWETEWTGERLLVPHVWTSDAMNSLVSEFLCSA